MLYMIFKLLISLVLGNWVYSEAVLMIPQFDRVARGFYHSVRIPTHNEWPSILREEAISGMEREIAPAQQSILPDSLSGGTLFGNDIRNLWRGWSFSSLWKSAASPVNKYFLTGESIFISPAESRRLFGIREVERLPRIKTGKQ